MPNPPDADFDDIRTLARGSITGSFVNIGSPIDTPVRIGKIVNNTNATLEISTDGVNVKDLFPANSGAVYDITGNSYDRENFVWSVGKQFTARHTGVAPTSGSGVHVVVLRRGP